METFKSTVKDKGDLAKSVIRILREMAERDDFIIEEESKKSNATTRKALEDKKLYTAKNVSDLFGSI